MTKSRRLLFDTGRRLEKGTIDYVDWNDRP